MRMSARATGAAPIDELSAAFADEAAFSAWYARALPRVYSFLASRCGGAGPLAEELTQQTFVEAVRRRHSFDGRSDVITWLCGIGRHKLADHYRRLEREERRRLQIVARMRLGEDADPWYSGEERDAIDRALAALPASQRAVLIFHHLDGMNVAEIGRLLSRSESAVESLLVRARDNFRKSYEGRSDA